MTLGSGQDAVIIPTGFILLIVLAIIMSIFLSNTKPGRYILSLGSNKEATRLSGVNVVKWETLAYVISGTFAGIFLSRDSLTKTVMKRRIGVIDLII